MTSAPTADGEPTRASVPPAGLPRGRSLSLRRSRLPGDSLQRREELFRTLGEKDTRVVVLNRNPPFHRLRAALFTRYDFIGSVVPGSRRVRISPA